MIKPNIIAVVVTFNRGTLLEECINALLNQTYPLDKIVVVNNASTDNTKEFLNKISLKNSKVIAINLEVNTGGSGGRCAGFEKADQEGANWILIMDDDGIPNLDALKILVNHLKFEEKDTVAMLSMVYGKDGSIQTSHRRNILPDSMQMVYATDDDYKKDFFETNNGSFVGILIKNLINQIGLPEKDFFIGNDDTEYVYRLSKMGKMYCIPKSIFVHKDGKDISVTEKYVLGRKVCSVDIFILWKFLMGFRNWIFMLRKHENKNILLYFTLLSKQLLLIILIEDKKFFRMKRFLKMFFDGWNMKLDNSQLLPGEWKKYVKQKFNINNK